MPPERAEVVRWLVKADSDRRTAEAVLAQNPPITDTAAFHVQQSVEKTLKAYLVWRGIEFEKIHDLRLLVQSCFSCDGEFNDLLPRVGPLTMYAVRFRYPGPLDPSVDEIRAALKVVVEVREFVMARLPDDIRAAAP